MYDARAKDMENVAQSSNEAAALGGWKTMAANAGMAGGMLGQGVSSLMGALPPEQAKQAKVEEMMANHPNPDTYEELMSISGEFMNVGILDVGEHFNTLAQDMIKNETSDKKWQDTKKSKIIDIRAEALRRGYKLPEDIIRSIANSSPDVSQVSNTTDTFIHPWMNALEAQLVGRKQYEGFMSGTAESTPASQATDTTPEKRASIELNRAETMRTKYNTEVADYKTNFESASSGLVNVKLHREGNNQSALPNITKNLAQMFNDKKLSQPEVKHAMSFGGLGERVVRKFSLWMSGELPPGDLNDIEEMFRRVALVSQHQMNAKTVDFRTRYGDKMSKKNLNSFLPAIATIPLTQQQRLEALKEQKRLRGI